MENKQSLFEDQRNTMINILKMHGFGYIEGNNCLTIRMETLVKAGEKSKMYYSKIDLINCRSLSDVLIALGY